MRGTRHERLPGLITPCAGITCSFAPILDYGLRRPPSEGWCPLSVSPSKHRLALTVMVLGTALYLLDKVETPHPYLYSPEAAAERLLRVDLPRRWKAVHDYGALCAETLSLRAIADRGMALPEVERMPFFDGAAHHERIPFDALAEWVAEIKTSIPVLYQSLFFEGLMRPVVLELGNDPAAVVAKAAEITRLTGALNLSNGIRIGLQQGFGHQMSHAIDLAATYPESLHETLFEELGWRWGDEHHLNTQDWREHTSHMPQAGHCAFSEGMIRGHLLRATEDHEAWWPELNDFLNAMQSQCYQSNVSGIAEGILIIAEDPDEDSVAMLSDVSDQVLKNEVQQLVRARSARDN